MGTRKFQVKTVERFDRPVLGYSKKVFDSENKPLNINPNRNKKDTTTRSPNVLSINIHEIDINDNDKALLREITNSISIELIPEWENEDKFYNEVRRYLNNLENPENVLALSIWLVCPILNYIIASKQVSLASIDSKDPIVFSNIDLNDIKGKIEIKSSIIRIKNTNPSRSLVAYSKLSVIAKNDDVTFFIDEIERIGGNSLEIIPDELGNKMFEIREPDTLGIDPPILIYNKEFQEYFNNGDDYKSVQIILLLIGLPYCDELLKWILFGRPSFSKPEHEGTIKFIAELCDTKESELESISNSTDFQYKAKEYISLNKVLFNNVQDMGRGWKNYLHSIIKNEQNA